MGIARGMIKLLMREGKREEYSGHVLTIGRQDILETTAWDLQRWAREMNFKLKPIAESLSSNKKILQKMCITDIILFQSLGFKSLDSIDYSDFEQCTITHDLNTGVPVELYDRYDLIVDAGTSEHIFNLPKTLENYNRMLKVGGRIIHALPSSTNHMDHGFYMFSPTLFWDYYSANNWKIEESLLFRHSRRPTGAWDVYKYAPGCLTRFSYRGFNNKDLYSVFFAVKKTANSTFNASVNQGAYLEIWKNAIHKNIKLKPDNAWKKRVVAALPGWLKLILYPLHDYLLSKIPPWFYLRFIGRY